MNEKDIQNDERLSRLNKIKNLKDSGVIVYKDSFEITHKSNNINDDFEFRNSDAVLESPNNVVAIAGRIMTERDHGGIIFLDLQDSEGLIQVAIKEKIIDDKDIKFYREFIDRGDFVGVNGEPFITKQGKIAVLASSIHLLSKSMRPLPSEHFGLKNTELKYRKRYLDLTLDAEARERFQIRSRFVEGLRNWLLENKFLEVVTRTLQPTAGGAIAKPFLTHHNMLDRDLFLRISNELDLKMAIGCGFDRVFEFAIDFRNEGIDSSHLQEFQMLEWYAAYKNYRDAIVWTKELLRYAVKHSIGTLQFDVEINEKIHTIDLSKEIPVVSFQDLLKEKEIDMHADKDELVTIAKTLGFSDKHLTNRSRGNLLDDIYKKKIRPNLIDPIIVVDYPFDLLPLARRSDKDPSLAEAFQLIIGTWEIVKGYSELVDPIEQRESFAQQQKEKELGDEEAMSVNEEFLEAMEHGFPPITGWGMGIDRFVSLMTGQKNLKDTVLFPLLGDDNS